MVGQVRVALATRGETDNVGRSNADSRQAAVTSPNQANLSHMGHIEQARRFTGMLVLLDNAGWIIERHLVSSKGNEFRTQLEVQSMKRG